MSGGWGHDKRRCVFSQRSGGEVVRSEVAAAVVELIGQGTGVDELRQLRQFRDAVGHQAPAKEEVFAVRNHGKL